MTPKPALRTVDDVELPAGPFDVPVARTGLTIPRIRVVPADGEPYEIQALNPDLLNYEDTAAVHRWKGAGDAPFRWLTFLAWSASRRTGVIDKSVTWETFKETTMQIESVGDDAAVPTRPDPGTG